MSAVDALEIRRTRNVRNAPAADAADFAWRVLILLNLFRLTIGTVLLGMFYLIEMPRIVREAEPNLAWAALLVMLGVGCVELVLLRRRFPGARVQTYLQFGADLTAIALLLHASGGIARRAAGIV